VGVRKILSKVLKIDGSKCNSRRIFQEWSRIENIKNPLSP
jgi:hypothetical protein